MSKFINCTVLGTATDTPVLLVDTFDEPHYARFESPSRAIFELPESVPPWGATIHWEGGAVRVVVPQSGAVEGPLIQYVATPPPIARIRIDGTRFLLNGQPWIWRGCTDFLLFKRFLHGQNMTPLLNERRELGANLVRVLGMAHHIERFYPQDYGRTYYDSLPAFARFLTDQGFYLEFVTFADQQEVQVPEQAHFADCCAALRDAPNVFVELGNEVSKNGIDPRAFQKPAGLLSSQGSEVADTAPPLPGWDYHTWHGRRDWPKVTSSTEDMWYVSQGYDGPTPNVHPPKPIVHDEPMGFAEEDIPGRRSNDPRLARQLAATAAVLGAGATFHSESGLRSEPFGNRQAACARAFFEALTD